MTQEEHTGDDPELRSRRAATATHASTLRLRGLSVQSADWIWVHYGQFAAVMLLLAGFVVLHRALVAGDSPRIVDQLAFIATIMSAATLTVFRRLCPETRRRRMGGRHWARTDDAVRRR
jgi:hypothetical protein